MVYTMQSISVEGRRLIRTFLAGATKPIVNLLGYQQSRPHGKRRVRILTLLITNQCSLSQMFGSLSNNS